MPAFTNVSYNEWGEYEPNTNVYVVVDKTCHLAECTSMHATC